MRAIVIEDEVNVRKAFIKSIEAFCPEVEMVGFASNVKDGVELINGEQFDILFLDINLPDGTGFDIIEQIDQRDFMLIFVTAYDAYAVKAFKLSAVDYLLKPVSPDLLIRAVEKVRKLKQTPDSVNLKAVKEHLDNQFSQRNKIILKDMDSIYIKQISDILFCQAEGSYTRFKFVGGSEILTSTNLKEYEQLLRPFKFSRNHHSYLCNLHHVQEIKKMDGGILIMSDGAHLPISARKKSAIIDALKTLFIN